jgi:hypothetical protein
MRRLERVVLVKGCGGVADGAAARSGDWRVEVAPVVGPVEGVGWLDPVH